MDLLFDSFIKGNKLYLIIKYRYFANNNDHLKTTISYMKNKVVKRDGYIIDIGAANGDSTLLFAKEFPNFSVIGFEPIPYFYNIAKSKCQNNTNIELRNIALSNSVGQKDFFVASNFVSSSLLDIDNEYAYDSVSLKEKIVVQTNILDNEIKNIESLDLIKIDVQGAEKLILEYGINTIKKTKLILIEMSTVPQYKNGCLYFEVDELLRRNGFKLVGLFNKQPAFIEFDALYENSLLFE